MLYDDANELFAPEGGLPPPEFSDVNPVAKPFIAAGERSFARIARAHRRAAAIWCVAGLGLWIGMVAAGAPAPAWVEPAFALHLAIAWLHLCLALPIHAAFEAARAVEETRGAGAAEGHEANLLAVPGLPRPLSFHLPRVRLNALRRGHMRLAGLLFAIHAAPLALAAATWLGREALRELPAAERPWIAIVQFGGSALLIGLFAAGALLPSALMTRAGASVGAGLSSNLGRLSHLLLTSELSMFDWAEIEKRVDLDDAWSGGKAEGAASFLAGAAQGAASLVARSAVGYVMATSVFTVVALLLLGGFGAMGWIAVWAVEALGLQPDSWASFAVCFACSVPFALAIAGASRLHQRWRQRRFVYRPAPATAAAGLSRKSAAD